MGPNSTYLSDAGRRSPVCVSSHRRVQLALQFRHLGAAVAPEGGVAVVVVAVVVAHLVAAVVELVCGYCRQEKS